MVWWWWQRNSGRASPSLTEKKKDYEGEGGQRRGIDGVRLPSLYPSIYRGKGGGGSALGFTLGGRPRQMGAPPRETLG